MSKRSRDLGLCVGVRVACCGPPHPNRDREKERVRQLGGGGGSAAGDDRAAAGAAVQQLDLYGVITREGSAANGGWFEVQLDSQPDKKVYYRRGSICKLKQQPHAHSLSQHSQQQQQQMGGAALRAITHSAHSQQLTNGVLAAAVATPATLLSAPSSPPAFVLQQSAHHQQQVGPSVALLLSPSMAHCGEVSAPPLFVQQCVSPAARPVCTCSLGCTPLLPSAPLSFLSSASARRASTGSVDGSLSLSLASLASPASRIDSFTPSGPSGCVELHSPPFASSRSMSTPSRPLLLAGVGSTSPSQLGSGSPRPSAFTHVASTAHTAVLAPRAVRIAGSGMDRLALTPLLHPLSAPVLPLSVAVPAARRLTASAASTTLASAAHAVPQAPFGRPHSLAATKSGAVVAACETSGASESAASWLRFDANKRQRLSLQEDAESQSLAALGAASALSACSATACLPATLLQPTLYHSVALCSL